jgi:hypothetical protein
MPTYTWKPNTNTTDYRLERSVDVGLTWTAITTITHDETGANYDSSNCTFFYVDGASVAGELVRIIAINGDGESSPVTSHGTPSVPAMIHLWGQVIHSVTGQPLEGIEVRVRPLLQTSTTFLPSGGDSQVVSIQAEPLMGFKREETLFTDTNGAWSIDVLRDLPVEVEIPTVQYSLKFRTPKDRDTLNLRDATAYRILDPEGSRSPFEYGVNSGFVT